MQPNPFKCLNALQMKSVFVSNDVNVLFLPGFLTSLSKGGVLMMLRGIFGARRVRLCVPGGFLKAACPGKRPCSGRGAGHLPACAGACQRPYAVGRFRRRAPGGFVRSSPSDLSPPLHRSWCGLIGVAAAILAVFGWFDVANIQHLERVCQVFLQLFLWLFFIWLWVRGMENVNFTFFGLWFPCWFQSASFRRQGLRVWFSRHTCGVPGYYKSASCRRLPDGLASPETPGGIPGY